MTNPNGPQGPYGNNGNGGGWGYTPQSQGSGNMNPATSSYGHYQQPEGYVPQPGGYGHQPAFGGNDGNNNGGGKGKTIAIASAVIVLLAVIGGGTFLLTKNDDTTEDEALASSSTSATDSSGTSGGTDTSAEKPTSASSSSTSASTTSPRPSKPPTTNTITVNADTSSITGRSGQFSPCTADSQTRAAWAVGKFTKVDYEEPNVADACEADANHVHVQFATLKRNPDIRADAKPADGVVRDWDVLAKDGKLTYFRTLKSGVVAIWADTSVPSKVEDTIYSVELSLALGGFVDTEVN